MGGGKTPWTWLADRHVLETRLTPLECEARLRARTASWPYRPTAEHPVAGSVSTRGFSLTKAVTYRNSFQTEARGTFTGGEPGARGGDAATRGGEAATRVQLTLGPSPLVLVLGAVWLLFVLWFFLTGIASDFPPVAANGWSPAAIPLGMLVVGGAALGVGRLMARGEAGFLLHFLTTELEAREVATSDRPHASG